MHRITKHKMESKNLPFFPSLASSMVCPYIYCALGNRSPTERTTIRTSTVPRLKSSFQSTASHRDLWCSTTVASPRIKDIEKIKMLSMISSKFILKSNVKNELPELGMYRKNVPIDLPKKANRRIYQNRPTPYKSQVDGFRVTSDFYSEILNKR